MTGDQAAALLAMLKIDLGITTTAYDARLAQYITASSEAIAKEGATLNFNNAEDMQLVVMYARWMWSKRDTGEGMPRMLRYMLNNRVFNEKMGADE